MLCCPALVSLNRGHSGTFTRPMTRKCACLPFYNMLEGPPATALPPLTAPPTPCGTSLSSTSECGALKIPHFEVYFATKSSPWAPHNAMSGISTAASTRRWARDVFRRRLERIPAAWLPSAPIHAPARPSIRRRLLFHFWTPPPPKQRHHAGSPALGALNRVLSGIYTHMTTRKRDRCPFSRMLEGCSTTIPPSTKPPPSPSAASLFRRPKDKAP